MTRVSEDRFLGTMLGFAIGDALGRPFAGLTSTEIAARGGVPATYVPLDDADAEAPSGLITDETEIALTLIESMTANQGAIDPENIVTRLGFLIRGDSRRWMSDELIAGIQLAEQHEGVVPPADELRVDLGVATRGVVIGLLHALDPIDEAEILRDAEIVTRLSHGGRAQIEATAQLARALHATIRGEARVTGTSAEIAGIVTRAARADAFTDALIAEIARGGQTDAIGATAGALLGARLGVSGIPQELIDQLDARIYLSLAVPWFFRMTLGRSRRSYPLPQSDGL